MTTTGLLNLGVTEIVERKTGELLGYAFTEASGSGLLERWLLFRHPENEFEVRPPPEAMSKWSLDDWQKKVPELWRPNGYYVWTRADVYRYGETYNGVTWTEIPQSSRLPEPSFPDRPGSDFQLDYLDQLDYRTVAVVQDDWRGRGYVLGGLNKEMSVEYWSLPGRFKPAGTARTAISSAAADQANSLDAFIKLANRDWSPGAAFVITGCVNYKGEAAPFAP